MAIKFKALALSLLLALGLTEASAQSGCGGQAAAGRICGNAAGTTGLPGLVTGTALFDQTFGATSGRLLNRGPGGWLATATPTLGLNGATGGGFILNGATSGSAILAVPAVAGATTFTLPPTNGTVNQVLTTNGAGILSWNTAGSGTVSSVGLSMPAIYNVVGSPVTGADTLVVTLATQTANTVWSGPAAGGPVPPSFRVLVGADLPNPSASTLGGVRSFSAPASQWINQISVLGVPTASQPAFTDISGVLAAAQCPTPSASTLGCVQSLAPVASRWISTISTSGVPGTSQPAFSDLSGSASLSQFPSISNNSVLGNNSGGTAVPSALNVSQVLDFAGATQGQILYRNASTWVPLSPGVLGQVLSSGGPAANPAWSTVTGTGTVTTVNTGTGLTGGPITTGGTVQFANIGSNTILSNVTGGSAVPSANTLSSILDIAGSATGNVLYRSVGGWTALAPGTNGQVLTMGASTPAWGSAGTVSTVSTSGILTGGPITTTGTLNINATITPQGRVTLASNTPVMTSTVLSSTVYYTPYRGNLVPIYDGTSMVPTAVAELSIPLGANWVINSNYDVFIASDAGTIRACTGPAWTSSTARGAGAGTTELSRTNGLLLNTVTLTCRYNNTTTFSVAANRGTYVGSFRTVAAGQVSYGLGGAGSGGINGVIAVWNMYNRVLTTSRTIDTGPAYLYTSAVVRQARASAGNQSQVLIGVAEDAISAYFITRTDSSIVNGSYGQNCMGVNVTSSCTTGRILAFNSGTVNVFIGYLQQTYAAPSLLGYNTYSLNESGDGSNASQFNGEANSVLSLSVWN